MQGSAPAPEPEPHQVLHARERQWRESCYCCLKCLCWTTIDSGDLSEYAMFGEARLIFRQLTSSVTAVALPAVLLQAAASRTRVSLPRVVLRSKFTTIVL